MIEQYKECTKCFVDRPLSEFYFRKDSNSYRNACKTCVKKQTSNFKKIIVPWRKHFYSARSRCINPKDNHYYLYGQINIKFLMTIEDFKFLWFRDKAWLLKQPSIERINVNENYELSNCEFIELVINSSYNKRPRNGKKLEQLSLVGNKINTFISIRQASRETGIPNSNISNVLSGFRKTAGGYKWRSENV